MSDMDEQAEEVRGARGKHESGGARIRMYDSDGNQDPMFRKLMAWSWAMFGTGLMGMQVWLVSNVADIKAALPRLTDKDVQIDAHQTSTDKRVDKLEDKYDYVRGKVDQYEGRTLRSGPEANRGR